jgi:hypothetical protein
MKGAYTASPAALEASDYFNSLPFEERAKLAPLLDDYRQMGLAEALDNIDVARRRIEDRIRGIRDA